MSMFETKFIAIEELAGKESAIDRMIVRFFETAIEEGGDLEKLASRLRKNIIENHLTVTSRTDENLPVSEPGGWG